MAPRSRRLQVEHLEDRTVPATFGMPWPDASRLSLSFAPDGTPVDGQNSALFSTLATLPTDVWKTEILRAFQTWAINGNINIGLVADGGQAFGVSGAVEGDIRFGDIRIGAAAMPVHLAMNSPFSMLAATRAGDALLNTGVVFGVGDPLTYDLYSLMLNESGNIFGIADSWTDPNTPMYEYYNGIRTGLTSGDIAALQALYGTRAADQYEGVGRNDSFLTATAVGSTAVRADVTTASDLDFYSFVVPSGTSTVTVRVKAGEVSLLTPRLTIYDSLQNVVATVQSTNPLDNTVLVQLNSLSPGTYFAKVEAARPDVFGVGAYWLRVFQGPASGMSPDPANNDFKNGNVRDDSYSNETHGTATDLDKSAYTTDSRFDYRVQGKLRDAVDVDYYKFESPELPAGTTQTMSIVVYGVENNGLRPTLTVYDELGNQVAAQVLVNDAGGTYVVQVVNAASEADYYVRVGNNPSAITSTGIYFLGIDFGSQAVVLSSAGAGTLDASNLQDFRTLDNKESQVFHFVLSSSDDPLTQGAVRMRIYDSNNVVVFTLVSKNGESVSGNIFLLAGEYTVRFEGGTQDGAPLPPLSYDLQAINVTDAIDPMPIDIIIPPIGVPKPPTFAWIENPETYYSFLDSIDPYSNPWTGF